MPTTDRLQSPPRSIPLLEQLALLCSGVTSFIGWMSLGMGILATIIFVGQSEAVLFFKFDGAWVWTEGVVQDVRPTAMSENERTIYALDFQYEVDNKAYQGSSYATYPMFEAGDSVELEYKEHAPFRARLEGGSEKPFSAWVAFVLLFPLIGMVFVISTLRRNVRLIRLLRDGLLTRGTLKNKEATNTSINENTVYAYAFEFEHNGRRYISKGKTHRTHLVEDEEHERILFSPRDPSYNIVYDTYAQAPHISPQGHFSSLPIRAYGTLAVAVFWILLNTLLFLYFPIL